MPARRGAKALRPGGEKPDTTGLPCSPKRACSRKPRCTTWQGGSGERAASGSWGGWRNRGGALKAAPVDPRAVYRHLSRCWPCPQGHTPRQGSLRKTPCGGDFKESLQHFGNGSRLGVLQRHQLTLGREPGAEMTLVVLV